MRRRGGEDEWRLVGTTHGDGTENAGCFLIRILGVISASQRIHMVLTIFTTVGFSNH
jgi:hypothetical protein